MTDEDLRKLLTEATPGPWELDGIAVAGNDHRRGDVCLMGEPAQYAGDTADMCDGWEANARLIAAAPDLAAEVLRLRSALRQIADHVPSFDYVRLGKDGPQTNEPGSPFDRGRAQEAKIIGAIARAALEGSK